MQQNRQTNAKAIASLVLSCASMICCVQWSISLVMAVLGIVFGILGLRDDNPNQEDAVARNKFFFFLVYLTFCIFF